MPVSRVTDTSGRDQVVEPVEVDKVVEPEAHHCEAMPCFVVGQEGCEGEGAPRGGCGLGTVPCGALS